MKKLAIFLVLFFSFWSILNAYNLTNNDKKIVNSFIKKVEKIDNSKNFKTKLSNKIEILLEKKHYSVQLTTILKEISKNLKWEKEVKVKEIKKETEEKTENNLQNNWVINYDFEKVKNYWLDLTNTERKKEWLYNYKYSEKLEETALKWSKIQKSKWKRTHQRDENDSYYDYNKIRDWFSKNWVVCKNIYRVTFTENVWSRWFACSNSDCTQEVKNAITNTFNFYMSEKNKESKPHYNSIMNKYFNYLWFGIDFEKKWNNYYKYYLTVHYCTELID